MAVVDAHHVIRCFFYHVGVDFTHYSFVGAGLPRLELLEIFGVYGDSVSWVEDDVIIHVAAS